MKRWVIFGAILVPVGSSVAGVLPVTRTDLTLTDCKLTRQETIAGNTTVYAQDFVYSDLDTFSGITPDTRGISSSGSGTMYDTATGTQLVASANGAASMDSTLTYSGADVAGYYVSGSYSSHLETGDLSGYNPAGPPPTAEAWVTTFPVYNAGLGVLVDVDTDVTINVTQSNTFGSVYNDGFLFLDFNEDGAYDTADGDISMGNVFVAGNGSDSLTLTLTASPHPYVASFFGNVYDSTNVNNLTLDSYADYTSSLTFVPEPATLSGAGLLMAAGLIRRRDRRA